MKIFSPHRRKTDAKRRFGGKEFQNKIKKAQSYKRVFGPRTGSGLGGFFRAIGLGTWWAKLLALTVICVPAYFLFISDYFVVTEISAVGGNQVSGEQIQDIFEERQDSRNFLIPKNHSIFLTGSGVEKLITQEFPLIKEVGEFNYYWPNKIELVVNERQPGFAFNISGQNYLVDDQGVVVKPIEDLQGLVQVVNQTDESVELGEHLTNTKLVGFILSTIRHWPEKINSHIKEARVPGKAAGQIQFVSQEGWGVFFDINHPVESQLSNLALILSRQIPAKDRLNLAYIDLRFDKWAYYCYKDQPCQSQPRPADSAGTPEDPFSPASGGVLPSPTPTPSSGVRSSN